MHLWSSQVVCKVLSHFLFCCSSDCSVTNRNCSGTCFSKISPKTTKGNLVYQSSLCSLWHIGSVYSIDRWMCWTKSMLYYFLLALVLEPLCIYHPFWHHCRVLASTFLKIQAIALFYSFFMIISKRDSPVASPTVNKSTKLSTTSGPFLPTFTYQYVMISDIFSKWLTSGVQSKMTKIFCPSYIIEYRYM